MVTVTATVSFTGTFRVLFAVTVAPIVAAAVL